MYNQNGIAIWLDDFVPPPDDGEYAWYWCTTAEEAIRLITNSPENILFIHFDHDLGTGKTGYDVANFVYNNAFFIKPFRWDIHSMNPSGAERIGRAMRATEKIWENV